MTPRHHVPDDLLVGYAAGTLTEAESLLVATHLAMCAHCRDQYARLEAVGGAVLESVAPVALSADALAGVLALLDTPAPPVEAPPALPGAFEGLSLPGPLREYVARSGRSTWESVLPGMAWQLTLPLTWQGTPVRIARMRGGFRVPKHTHVGRELNLVLSGGFHDRGEGFGPGDIADRAEETTHELHIDPGEECVLLAINEQPLVPVGPIAHLASWLTGF